MRKDQLASQVAGTVGLLKKQAEQAVDAIIRTMKAELSHDRPVLIRGFGAFTPVKKAARNGRNPKTGEPAEVKARTVVRFKASKALKQAVNS